MTGQLALFWLPATVQVFKIIIISGVFDKVEGFLYFTLPIFQLFISRHYFVDRCEKLKEQWAGRKL